MKTLHRPAGLRGARLWADGRLRGPGWLRNRRWVLAGVASGVAVVLLAGVAALAVRLNRPGLARTSAAAERRHPATATRAPAHGRAARFDIASGVDAITVRTGNIGDRMYQVSAPGSRAPVPHVTQRKNVFQLKLTGGESGGPSRLDIRLSSRLRWALGLSAGLGQTKLDLSQASLATLDFTAGLSSLDLTLPPPSGTVPVRLGAGAGAVTVHLGAGVPARVRVRAGLGNLTVNGRTRSGVTNGVYPVGTGYGSARNRYDIDLTHGVASLVVRPD